MELPLMKLSLFFSLTFHAIFVLFLNLSSTSEYAAAAVAVRGNETDKLSLLGFKSQLMEDPLGLLVSWNDSLHFCWWTGVKCGLKHQRVTSLDLKGQKLVGTISPHIGNLSFLRTLNLAENSFTGGIPPEFGRLPRLQNLNLSFNFIQGEIPVNLSHCSNLINLSLDHNNLTQQIPLGLGTLSKLVILYLRNNHLTGRFPASFGNLSSIQQLIMSYNNLEGEIPDTIAQMRSLTMLGVGMNNLSGVFPPPLYNLSSLQFLSLTINNLYGNLRNDIGLVFPNIQKLYLGKNRFTGEIPASLSNASNLLQIELAENEFTGNIPMSFGNLQALLFLNVPKNNLGSGAIGDLNFLTSLANCSKLQHLDFSQNHLGGVLSSSISNLSTQLRWLNIFTNYIHGSIPAEIANLVGLNAMGMGLNFLTGNIPASIGKLPNLIELYLGSNHLTGEIPSSFGNLTKLLYLYLHNNSLEGNIPSTFGNFKSLQEVDLSHNQFNSTIPKQLLGLSSLSRVLNLSHNSLTGSLPAEVGNLTILIALDISYNKFSSDIPSTLGLCLALEKLYIQGNFFQGTIPDLHELTGLQHLDVSSNNLHGQIPPYMANFPFLINLNLSVNNFKGEIPIDGVFKNASAVELFGNSYLCGGIQELHMQPCPVQKPRKHSALKLILVIVIVSTCLALMLSLLSVYLTKKSKENPHSTPSFGHFYPRISYKELLDATGGFSSRNLIGSGNFGTVYEGTLGVEQTTIAIKVLNLQQQGASKSFMAECQALRHIRHRNLVRILTVCSSTDFEGNDFRALVYQFMPNGSLEKWLHPEDEQTQQRSLNLLQRINIAVDVASALHYLHHQCRTPVVHCDLKPSNVLLDNDLTAHVSDFGLARLLSKFSKEATSKQFSSLGIKGTIGYAAPEYGMGGEVSTLGDVYSYGILLLEMFTGRRPTEESFRDNFNLHNFVKLSLPDQLMDITDQSALDREVVGEATNKKDFWMDLRSEQIECMISIFQIGVACSAEYPQDRMSVTKAWKELLSIREKFVATSVHQVRAN